MFHIRRFRACCILGSSLLAACAPSVRPGATPVPTVGVLELNTPAPDARVAAAPVVQWQPFPGATRYHVVVTDGEAADTVAMRDTTTADTQLAIAPPLAPGPRYRLTIQALDAHGAAIAAATTRFTVQRPTVTLRPCTIGGIAAQCGTYLVYEDRAARAGRLLTLRIAVLRATTSARAADPLFYFAGGPGGSAIDALPAVGPAFATLNQTRDLVFVEQRGTGSSSKLVCPEPSATLDISDAAAMVPYARDCIAQLEAEPGWYTTRAFVDDVDEVRQALGYDQINIAGGSYGATAAQVFLIEHAAHARTMTMMGGTLLDIPVFERIPWSSQRALDMVLARCAADQACHAAFPDVQTEFDAVLAQLKHQPVTSTVIDPQTGKHVVVTRDVFASLVHELLMGADTAAQIPRLVHRAARLADWDAVADAYAQRLLARGTEAARLLMAAVIRCGEPWAAFDAAAVTRTGAESYLAQTFVTSAQSQARICPVVPPPAAAARYDAIQPSDVPVLLLSGTEDPQNPPENVAGMQQRYPRSLAVFEPYRGHYTVEWSCISAVVTEFVERGAARGLQAACVDAVDPYAFDTRP